VTFVPAIITDFELLVAEVGDLLMNGREQTIDVVRLRL
jgi:hypothetical protein